MGDSKSTKKTDGRKKVTKANGRPNEFALTDINFYTDNKFRG